MARLSLKAEGKNQEILLDYLEKNASEPLAEKINTGVKTLAGCWEFIRKEARKQAMNGVAVIEDAEVFGWAVHYFEEDDIKEGKTSSYTQTPEQLRKMAIDAEQREKEIERRNARLRRLRRSVKHSARRQHRRRQKRPSGSGRRKRRQTRLSPVSFRCSTCLERRGKRWQCVNLARSA